MNKGVSHMLQKGLVMVEPALELCEKVFGVPVTAMSPSLMNIIGGKCAARGLTARGSMAIGHDGNIAIGFKRDISAKASARKFCHIESFIGWRVCSTPRHYSSEVKGSLVGMGPSRLSPKILA